MLEVAWFMAFLILFDQGTNVVGRTRLPNLRIPLGIEPPQFVTITGNEVRGGEKMQG